MPRGCCRRHGVNPCSCGMGNLYRFVEPLAIYFLKTQGKTYGYILLKLLNSHALTDSLVDPGALYRTLRRLEDNGYVTSTWDVDSAGPARRMYELTPAGNDHMIEWLQVLEQLSGTMNRFLTDAAITYPGILNLDQKKD